ncbi:hypothetical protein LTR28_011530 [Elasticomyces elasticus]|nr:hypothetical protein LTR28_011530 [Elasticomyces elasticus]
MDLARQVRIENRTLFSANHLQAFLDRAPKHVTSTASAPFSFIRASREQNPVGEEFATHVGRFLRLCIDGGAPEQFITSCTASAIIIDSFPPGMHPGRWCPMIEGDIGAMFSDMEAMNVTPSEFHGRKIDSWSGTGRPSGRWRCV